jgi:hypothetical protein
MPPHRIRRAAAAIRVAAVVITGKKLFLYAKTDDFGHPFFISGQ